VATAAPLVMVAAATGFWPADGAPAGVRGPGFLGPGLDPDALRTSGLV
jgi:hypothetical protein